MNETVVQYQVRADPLQDLATTVPLQDTPWVPRARAWRMGGAGAPPPVIALPYDFPLSAPAAVPLVPRRLVPASQTPEWGRADAAIVPTFFEAFGDIPIRLRRMPPATQSVEWGRADPPPVPAPDLIGASMPDVTRRVRQKMGVVSAHVVLPPGYPPEWFPLPERPRYREKTRFEAFASPVLRPTIPFEPAQGVADLPQPPLAPRRPTMIALKGGIPAGPPSAALTPPGTFPLTPLPTLPPRRALPRQPQQAEAKNYVPIIPTGAPNGSWYPGLDVPARRRRNVSLYQTFAQNLPPISTPAYLSSFWDTYRVALPPTRRGLIPALMQAYAEAPPQTTVIVLLAPWKPVFPDWLRRPRWLWSLLESPITPNHGAVAGGVGCIMVDRPGLTAPTLLSPSTTESTLVDPEMTTPTFVDPDLC